MVNVFISSTGKDLADYRDVAVEVCNRLGMVPIAMEFFEAMGIGATMGSKEKLNLADVYVGIFAHRYGYVEAQQQYSVTEIEYRYAGEREIERLCFLLAPHYPWPPDLIDYENYSKLKTFKEGINRTLIRGEFTTVDDFMAKLIQALVEWRDRNQGEAALVAAPPEERGLIVIAPPRPRLLVGRDREVAALKVRLGAIGNERQELTIIRGWPGVGKTTLVTSLAYDPDVTDALPDGILWSALGEQANPQFELAGWCRMLGAPQVEGLSLERLIGIVRTALADKRLLLIVDDVWKSQDAIPFKQVAGPSCALLITTRFAQISQELATTPSDVYLLDVLSLEGALDLLRRVAPVVIHQYPTEARQLLDNVEYLPLAIRVVGRLLETEVVRSGSRVIDLMNELRESHRLLDEVAPDDRFDVKTGTTPTINLLLKRSTDRLDDTTRLHFAMLGAFAAKPATFEQEAMKFVWEVEDPMPTIRQLVDQGLLEPIPADGRFQMHALLVMHARRLLKME